MLQLLIKHALAGAFDDNEVRTLVEAFDQAWNAVQDSATAVWPGAHSEAIRELLALRIVEIAQLGERDPNPCVRMPWLLGSNQSQKHRPIGPTRNTGLYPRG
jgi:hypothetical protein